GLFAPVALRAAPPVDARLHVLEPDGFGHRVRLLAIGHAMLEEPRLLRRFALLEEEQVRADARVGLEDAVRQPDDGVQVALFQQRLFETGLHALAKERSVGEHDGGAATCLEQADDERQEEISGLLGAEVLREVRLYAVFLASA